jgi:hypothetical protein
MGFVQMECLNAATKDAGNVELLAHSNLCYVGLRADNRDPSDSKTKKQSKMGEYFATSDASGTDFTKYIIDSK